MTATCFGFLPKAIFRLWLSEFCDIQFTMFSNRRSRLQKLFSVCWDIKYKNWNLLIKFHQATDCFMKVLWFKVSVLLGCDSVPLGEWFLTFRGLYCRHPQGQAVLLGRRQTLTQRHGAAYQKVCTFSDTLEGNSDLLVSVRYLRSNLNFAARKGTVCINCLFTADQPLTAVCPVSY